MLPRPISLATSSLPSVCLGDPLSDGESKTRAAATRPAAVGAVETFEDVRQILRGNADACIGHRNGHVTLRGGAA